mmetsp:Transcript_55844/g.62437  ORF Transcript_55844/g.62437 Transcript_55844/m.62437 type:complete len:119 (-) Transcript_55844:55-411(-)
MGRIKAKQIKRTLDLSPLDRDRIVLYFIVLCDCFYLFRSLAALLSHLLLRTWKSNFIVCVLCRVYVSNATSSFKKGSKKEQDRGVIRPVLTLSVHTVRVYDFIDTTLYSQPHPHPFEQ